MPLGAAAADEAQDSGVAGVEMQPSVRACSIDVVTRASTPCHRSDHPEGLGSRGDLFRQRIVDRFERDVFPAGEEADEVSALRRPVIADRAPEGWVIRLQRIQDGALRRPVLGVEDHLSLDARKGAQVLRKDDADHGSVWASTESTAGRSCTTAVQLSPPSGEA